MSEYNFSNFNGLSLRLDWLAFVVNDFSCVNEILSMFGFSLDDFTLLDRGGYGYGKQLFLNGANIRVYYEGNSPSMGVYISVSGSAISCFFEAFRNTFSNSGFSTDDLSDEDIMRACLSLILSIGHITRLDTAIDDKGCNFFSVDELADYYNKRQIVTRFQSYDPRRPEKNHVPVGNSLNFGSRTSDTYLRIYDKQLEQKETFPWVRYEYELKNDTANNFVRLFVDGMSLPECIMGVMNNYFRIINLDNANISRCSTLEKWAEFTGTVMKLSLSVPHEHKTLEEKEKWFEKTVMKTVVALFCKYGGSLEFISNKFQTALYKLSKDKNLCAELGGTEHVLDFLEYYSHDNSGIM